MSATSKKPPTAGRPTRPLLEDDSLFPASWSRSTLDSLEVQELPADAAWAEWESAVAAQNSVPKGKDADAQAGSKDAQDDFADTNLLDQDFPPTDIAPLE